MSAAIRTGQNYKYTITTKKSKSVLSSEEEDLYELCQLAGISMSPKIYRIVLELIRMNIGPHAILQVLKSMTNNSRHLSPNVSQNMYRPPIESTFHPSTTVNSSKSQSRSRIGPHS
ncbi:mitotic-spindle organizing protein 2-like [Glandiceps talaboti]